MIDLTWTTHRFASPSSAKRRVLVLVDQASADARLIRKVAPVDALPPASIVWLWVVTPGAVVSWGALLSESGDRTRILLSALSERMEEARRYMTPLQVASNSANIPCQTHILHGTVTESVVRLARRRSRTGALGSKQQFTLWSAGPRTRFDPRSTLNCAGGHYSFRPIMIASSKLK